MRELFPELVQLPDEVFVNEIAHASALFDPARDPDLTYSASGLRRLGRRRPPIDVCSAPTLRHSGMRTRFGAGSPVRVEIFYEEEPLHGRRPASASVRSGRQGSDSVAAFRDPARTSLTEHALSYLIRNDGLGHPVPAQGADLSDWMSEVRRAAHWVSDMPRHQARLCVDDTALTVTRIDDPRGRWAAAAFDTAGSRITLAGPAGFLDLSFCTTRPGVNAPFTERS